MAARKGSRTRSAPRAKTATKPASKTARKPPARAARSAAAPKRKPAAAAKRKTAAAPKRRATSAAKRAPSPASKPSPRPAASVRGVVAAPTAARPESSDFASAIGTITQHLDFTTHDPEALQRFYGDVLGLSAQRDGAPGAFRVRLNPGASVAFRPPAPGPPEQWRPPREPVMVFVVADADRAYETLSARGVTFDRAPADLSWGARGALLRDPEGRMMWIVHPLVEA